MHHQKLASESTRYPYVRYTIWLALALVITVVSLTASWMNRLPGNLTWGGAARASGESQDLLHDPHFVDIHERPEAEGQPLRFDSSDDKKRRREEKSKLVRGFELHSRKRSPAHEPDPSREQNTPWAWANAGGDMGLSGDWLEALRSPNSTTEGGASIKGDQCSSEASQTTLRWILHRRKEERSKDKVAICVRTKDFGRYIPEWIAFHYVIGVDEIVLYDDESVDNTRELVRPFEAAGIVTYVRHKLGSRAVQMRPLNHCLLQYMKLRAEDPEAPRWIMFHDMDEYIYPENTTLTIADALREYEERCCVQVRRIQYGSSGYRETPRGLSIEMFLQHARTGDAQRNRLPKLVVNLDPSKPEDGTVAFPLPSMHDAHGCTCLTASSDDMRINHYLGSVGDFMDKNRRYWKEGRSMEVVERYMRDRDVNDCETDTITHWACATREILARVVDGLDLGSGEPLEERTSREDPGGWRK